GQFAAAGLHPEEARERLRRPAAEAVAGREEVRPFALSGPRTVVVDLAAAPAATSAAARACPAPGLARADSGSGRGAGRTGRPA
ncbi:M55 family metallopeptidase, partial [Streptomyces albidoflavus]|uniref:M55 family metallopeptidase n=1 Tax=Streptomyces albidoflavus TaxID=1886 RepID=UPI00211BB630